MKKIVILWLFMVAFSVGFAIPAPPHPVKVSQPDGKEITIWIKGDERMSWSESLDGYTVLRDEDGYMTYAVMNKSGDLEPSKFVVTEIEERDKKTKSFLKKIEKDLFWKSRRKESPNLIED